MNKHPSGYYGGQPPLGPGQPPPPPPVAGQPYDAYSTWSAAAAAAQQQYYAASAAAAVVPQPAPGINPYANYGYGPAATWAHHHHHRPPAAIPAMPPQIPAYSPYQPQPQPYGPQGHPQPPTVYPPRPLQPPPPQPISNQHPPAGPRNPQQPPLKRQRVQSTSSNGPSRFPPPPNPPARPPTDPPASLPSTPATSFNRGGRHGGGMAGNNSGGLRGRGHSMRPVRGGRGSGMGNRPMNHGSRTSSSSAPRGPRRGTFPSAVAPRVSRGQFEAPQSHNGWGSGPVGFTPASSGIASSDKEGKRTLTDFRIVGFGFVSEHTTWSWGTTRLVDEKAIFPPPSTENGALAIPPPDEASPVKQEEVDTAHEQAGSAQEKGKKAPKETARIRIYFQPAPGSVSRGVGSTSQIMPPPNAVPSRASAKRKKSETEEDDGDRHNVKRHHGDHDESRPASLIVEMLDPNTDGTNGSNSQIDAPPAESNSNTISADIQRDTEQGSEVSNDADWLGEALKEEGEEEENPIVEGYPSANGEEPDAAEFLDELDEEDEEATSLFGSGVHPSPPNLDGNGATDLIVQAVDDPGEGEGDLAASEARLSGLSDSQRATSTPAVGGQSSGAGGPGGAGNKLSISFSTSRRRLVLEVEVIKYLRVFRAEGRIEFVATLERTAPTASSNAEDSQPIIKGVCMDVWDEPSQSFQSVAIPSASSGRDVVHDAALPPLYGETNVTFHVFLDLDNPLSVPRWVKTGDVDDWLQTMFGAPPTTLKGANVKHEEAADSAPTRGWEGKITVVDPDPAPTLQNVLETWATNSMIAQQKDREQFLKSHLYLPEKPGEEKREHDMDNIMEILLRLIRGDRPLIGAAPDHYHHHHHHYHHNNANNSVHPILQAAVGSDPALVVNQTHSSLAVLAMFRIIQQTALKYGGKEVKKEVEDQVREIVKCLPPHMINKSLDGMFQKWLASHGGGSSKGTAAKNHR